MGRDLKGKELGQGICQLQDGRYMARYTNRHGKRISLYSLKLKELRDMKRKAEYEDRLGGGELINKDIYLRDIYKEWIKKKSNEIRPTTLYIYKNNYNTYIKPPGVHDPRRGLRQHPGVHRRRDSGRQRHDGLDKSSGGVAQLLPGKRQEQPS